MHSGKTKNIVLIDDHLIIRHGLKGLIEQLGPYKISHQFDKGEEFISNIPTHPNPDLIILDLSMPGMGGDEVMENLNQRGINIPVLILTIGADESMVAKLFKLGIKGYMVKNCNASELKRALEEIFQIGYFNNEFRKTSLTNNLPPKENSRHLKKVQEYMLFRIAESTGRINIKISDIIYLKTHDKGRQTKLVILKGGVKYTLLDCGFNELLEASSYLIRVNKSELISLEVFEKLEGDLITLKGSFEGEKPKQITLNRWYKKDFLDRLSPKQ